MSLETGTYINSLVVTNPTSTDPKSEGDDHLRLLKSTIKNTFPNINAAVTVTDEEINAITTIASLTKKIVYGNVSASGGIVSGTGYTITKGSTGVYAINFTSSYVNPPAVTANNTGSYGICMFLSITTTQAIMNIVDLNNNLTDSAFSFHVIGAA